jgi:hypothetical protein
MQEFFSKKLKKFLGQRRAEKNRRQLSAKSLKKRGLLYRSDENKLI